MSENNIINSNAEAQEVETVPQPVAAETAETENVAEPVATEPAPTEDVAQTEATEKPAAQINVPVHEPVAETLAAHDDFDWSIDKRNVSHYTKKKRKSTIKCMKTLSYRLKMAKL